MQKITKPPETKEEFHKYHIIMWQGAIDDIKTGKFYSSVAKLKKEVFNAHFDYGDYPEARCFGCEWEERGTYNDCLFGCDCIKGCLDGIFNKFEFCYNDKDKENSIKYAEQIRDFPVRG